ncbi:unnamed protein product [Didymodactylos carnosus]|uniref:Mediator of RNA polymerase II transcription subunit 30 n=1 Tax=Didymodactylos carnosus TaxID=1234261 RepID=A0A814VLZ6_9BILA|nr:unnamed protein product [Didymodactylos carnosus]CAF1194652.1 unnamed protein product [Didymodactylos carnosus]CAF3957013.1 unnamed protein product [Didymodactylos carnosus]CAF4004943.1 unnamed protein product [Didymodactylos carnosus]
MQAGEPLTRLACIRQCQETVQELVSKPADVCTWLKSLCQTQTNATLQFNEKKQRFEELLNGITLHFNTIRHLFVRLREIYEHICKDPTPVINKNELDRLIKQREIYEEILFEKKRQIKITLDSMRDLCYQINTMLDLRQESTEK